MVFHISQVSHRVCSSQYLLSQGMMFGDLMDDTAVRAREMVETTRS